jgi:hypothetical protein
MECCNCKWYQELLDSETHSRSRTRRARNDKHRPEESRQACLTSAWAAKVDASEQTDVQSWTISGASSIAFLIVVETSFLQQRKREDLLCFQKGLDCSWERKRRWNHQLRLMDWTCDQNRSSFWPQPSLILKILYRYYQYICAFHASQRTQQTTTSLTVSPEDNQCKVPVRISTVCLNLHQNY